ncbi:MAG: bifunctional hydroxymethylpyrimidine kinase/phosphomethylpyrimidine kinase, partial [Thermoplasmata archaeon]|nr:bifunctional hydroxymethylpyrimidine kinase/phosphomethylpyrimidine kinase [Thermoplasmata archaeon]
ASGVLVKGIQEDDKITDFLLMADGSSQILSSTRWPGKFHGTGCMLSALIAGHVSLGDDVCTAVVKSRGDVFAAIEKARTLGKGIKMIEPLGKIHREAMKIEVIDSLEEMRHVLESDVLASLLPEVGSNLAYSLPAPLNESEVAGFTGRIVREGKRSRVVGCARFGASKHVARIVISASMNDLAVRSAMNIKYNEANLEACKKAGLSISSFSRKEEPEGVSSMSWGTNSAIKKRGSVPDIIWDEGGMGKEPMIRILGRNPKDIVSKVKRISDNFGK